MQEMGETFSRIRADFGENYITSANKIDQLLNMATV
jgi:hypothetical protein